MGTVLDFKTFWAKKKGTAVPPAPLAHPELYVSVIKMLSIEELLKETNRFRIYWETESKRSDVDCDVGIALHREIVSKAKSSELTDSASKVIDALTRLKNLRTPGGVA